MFASPGKSLLGFGGGMTAFDYFTIILYCQDTTVCNEMASSVLVLPARGRDFPSRIPDELFMLL